MRFFGLSVLVVFCVELKRIYGQDGVMFGADEVQQKSYCNDEYQYACASGECIAKYDRCDGVAQCYDGSDELNCPDSGGYPPEQKIDEVSQKVELKPKTNTTTVPPKHLAKNGLSLRLVAGGLFGVLALSALLRFVVKRRKARAANRNIRKGDSLLNDEEDDLLISQMYA